MRLNSWQFLAAVLAFPIGAVVFHRLLSVTGPEVGGVIGTVAVLAAVAYRQRVDQTSEDENCFATRTGQPPGEPVTLDSCEREPIHLPGMIQAHGAVVVVRRDETMAIVQASENVPSFLGLASSAECLLGRPLAAVVGGAVAARLASLPTKGPPAAIRPEVIEVEGRRLVAQCFVPAEQLLATSSRLSPTSSPTVPRSRSRLRFRPGV